MKRHWAGDPAMLDKVVSVARAMSEKLDFFKQLGQWWEMSRREQNV